ncbi:hypothetical protein DKX38_028637 [Salix brachista]|uniref:BHLH domain-containing protein n=1 Tax=Salix brachista TaxID=2182728 RepID=A0A5N5J6D3_9ROSI|nr:hypothetical protein DKX38_028637 [Salix brachista]
METFVNNAEYQNYKEMTDKLWNNEQKSWAMDQASSQYCDPSLPDGAASAIGSKSTVSERNRRKKLNDKFFALREAVPKISKLRVTSMGEKTLFVSLTCSQAREATARICEVFESLKVMKIITASVTTVSGMVKTTILIEADGEEKDHLKLKIERAISALSAPYNHLSM